jgi:hypothetical protein
MESGFDWKTNLAGPKIGMSAKFMKAWRLIFLRRLEDFSKPSVEEKAEGKIVWHPSGATLLPEPDENKIALCSR